MLTGLEKLWQNANCTCRTSISLLELLRNAKFACRTTTSLNEFLQNKVFVMTSTCHHEAPLDINWTCRTCPSFLKPLLDVKCA